ncbi:NUDIX domain-containing protein [Actinokineospora soli]|uniref:NUDIX domain-containing protein n=1 Tax=Actinokineospora soli TaxID=1048753 RepID=A0ABW2TQV6_9PSEU
MDVLALTFDPRSKAVLLGVAPRAHEPYAGAMALPGVLLGKGERLRDAARRAVIDKLGMPPTAISATGQLTTFDEPSRDPRGPTLSIALWSTLDVSEANGDRVTWTPLDDVPPLAFDHDRIVSDCRPMLADRLWRDPAFTADCWAESSPPHRHWT